MIRKRLLSIVAALALLFVIVTPTFAYTTGGGHWEFRNDGNGYAVVPVCAAANFGDANGGWDFSLQRHDAVRDMLNQFNSLGLKLLFTTSGVRCSQMTTDRVEVRWTGGSNAPNNKDGRITVAYTEILDKLGFPCTSHCMKVAQIVIDTTTDLNADQGCCWGWSYSPSSIRQAGEADFREAFLHELGHAAGLLHSSVEHSIMCSSDLVAGCDSQEEVAGPGPTDRTYDPDDIAGFCADPWNDDPNDPGNVCQ
jgi:hypothetical protein